MHHHDLPNEIIMSCFIKSRSLINILEQFLFDLNFSISLQNLNYHYQISFSLE